jgi:2-oxoisovalerate dehydrogenase E1 component
MPKVGYIDPAQERKGGEIKFSPIPVNQYNKSLEDEMVHYTKEELIGIYRDMVFIREFETMLNEIKIKGDYQGIAYNHPGPAHLSIGQEASAVGMAFHLDVHDYIFGSHRSHGEILAKGLSAIAKLDDDTLLDIMQKYWDGATLRPVEKNFQGSVKQLAIDFLLYGTLAEIFGKAAGFNKGLGGSMHAFFLPFGVYPNNAIVGGSADIATGAALFKKVNVKPGIVVANIGDASMGCGPVWEAMCFASMDQFRLLWEGEFQGGLPIIFNFMNNQYGMGGQTRGETMGYDILARVGAAFAPYQMHAERVDGYNPLAVADIFKRKKTLLEEKKGPVLIDTLTYRYSGHSPSDASSYRTKEEVDAWQSVDSILGYGESLLRAGLTTEAEMDAIKAESVERVSKALKLAGSEEISPRLDLVSNPDAIAELMFSDEPVEKFDDREPQVNHPMEENPRVQQISKKERYAFKDGKEVSKMKAYQLRDGLFEAIIDRFYKDPTTVAYGEENRDWGGAFAVYRGLTEALPYNRLFNSPISEGAIVGTAIGYAMCGGRVIPEIMYCDFLGRCGDEVFNQLCKWQAMSGGLLKMPVVMRVSVGSKYGAQHSQDWSSMVAMVPGIKIIFPVTPYDAKGLLNTALNGSDPVIVFESQRVYDVAELFHEEGVPEGYYEIPLGEPDVKRKGKDVTILTIGSTLYTAIKAADELKEKFGMEAEVIDARSLIPFNYEPVIESVKKTGRILLASDACEKGSFLKDMAQTISETCFDYLDAPPVVVGSRNWITPAYEMEKYFFPQPSWIIDAIHEKILPLPGHTAENNFSIQEQIRRNRLGV